MKNLNRASLGFFLALCLLGSPILPKQPLFEPASKASTVFSNPTPISIETAGPISSPMKATLYPSAINVSGMTGNITSLEVTLDGFTHNWVADIDMLLVGPTGAKYVFLSDSGGSSSIADRSLRFGDAAPAAMSPFNQPTEFYYRPSSGDTFTDVFPSPAPAGPYAQPAADTFASVFNGTSPNGEWKLFASDDRVSGPGFIRDGWSLTITTDGGPQTFSNTEYIGFHDGHAASAPYGTGVDVSGLSGVVSGLRLTMNGFSHTNPQNVDILLISPNGSGTVVFSDLGSSSSVSGLNITLDDGAATPPPNPLVSGTFKPSNNSGIIDFFPGPAPPERYFSNSSLSSFNGISPNGEWRLFVTDDQDLASGSISGGWSLEVTTSPPPPPSGASCVFPSFSQANPGGFPAGSAPSDVVVGDLNGDNIPDVAVANQVSNNVSIHLGNGSGGLGAPTFIPVGSGPFSLVAARFNGDNFLDIAVANSGSNNVSILLGNGDGTFSAPTNFVAGASPISVAAGDLNNDGNSDLVVANFGSFFLGTVSVLFGNGSGAFSAGPSLRTRTQPSAVAVGNLNGDSNLDLVVANFGSDSLAIFFGIGGGSFQLSQNVNSSSGPVAVEIVPEQAGGFPQILAANYNSDSVTVCGGSQNGSFSCSTQSAGGSNPIAIVTDDFLVNGQKTRAVALSGSNTIAITGSSFNVGQYPNAIASGDMNNDGRPDVITANYGSDNLSVLLNSCTVAKGNLMDFNGDRRTDLGVYRTSNYSLYVNPSFSGPRPFGRPVDHIVPADYDGNGATDVALYRPSTGLWWVQDSAGRTLYYTTFGLPDDIPVPADYDGDGKFDIAVYRPSNGSWYVRRSSDNAVHIIQFGLGTDRPVPADYDGDGKADIAVYRPSTGVWYIFRSSDSGYTIENFGIETDLTIPADFDGDGKADVAVYRPSTGVWYVFRSSDGGVGAVAWGGGTDIPAPGDYDGDGKWDQAIFRPADGNWWILRSGDGGVSTLNWGTNGDLPLPRTLLR